uniref:Uncharacterized protein n=1 Tax=Melopsittacus undulatus TaxID=13146 RepID=A0A8V5H104_MELUD
VIEGWSRVLDQLYPMGEEEEGRNFPLTNTSHNEDACIPWYPPDDVPHQQQEGIASRGAEVGAIDASHHDVGVPIEELEELLQAPEAAFEAAQQELGHFILCSWEIEQEMGHDPDDLDDGEDEGAEGQGARVVPERSQLQEWDNPQIIGCEGSGQSHLAQGDAEVAEPEEHEEVIELEGREAPVVPALAPIGGEEATGVRALETGVTGGEGLRRTRGIWGLWDGKWGMGSMGWEMGDGVYGVGNGGGWGLWDGKWGMVSMGWEMGGGGLGMRFSRMG